MTLITGLSAAPMQNITLTSETGQPIRLSFRFMPLVSRWTVSLTYKDFALNGYKLHTGPNVLAKYFAFLRWGLMVTSADAAEPIMATDFSTGRISVYLLDQAECEAIEAEYRRLADVE